ncbi:hypothetical protein [Thorsellia kenyensis]|uniref:Lipoprotein n=1 Tax=Thorsellia kenyensis TaxID=1549888 RepID=A0ABV6CAA1_9GAMM
MKSLFLTHLFAYDLKFSFTNYFKKFSLFLISLICLFLLSACNIKNDKPAPITQITDEKLPSKKNESVNPSIGTSSSYPLPEPPVIHTTSSYTVSSPLSSNQIMDELIVNPDSEITLTSNSQNHLGQLNSTINAPMSSDAVDPNKFSENKTKGIASNSTIIVNTPKINYIAAQGEPNWQKMSVNAINSMIQSEPSTKSMTGGLYVNTVSNQSNTTLPVYVIDQLLIQATQEYSPFSVVSQSKINEAKNTLNIPANDTLVTISKSLAIAQAMQAPYILFSSISGENEATKLTVQLIDTSSAEILAQGESSATY